MLAPPTIPEAPTTRAAPLSETRSDRRQLLRRAGMLAAGAAAGGAALAVTGATPAGAQTGDAVVAGKHNIADATTILGYNGQALAGGFSGGVLMVSDTYSGGSLFSAAVHGLCTGSATFAVVGEATGADNTAVYARATHPTGIGLMATGGRANVWLEPKGAAPNARGDLHGVGEVVVDASGDLWVCVVAGTPGIWRKLGGPTTAGSFHLLPTPRRVYDSRPAEPPAAVKKGRFDGETRVIDTRANGSNVPAGATAVVLNLTVTNTDGAGFVSLYKNGIAYPKTSSINWAQPNTTVANGATVAVDGAGKLAATCVGQADVIIDVTGYYL